MYHQLYREFGFSEAELEVTDTKPASLAHTTEGCVPTGICIKHLPTGITVRRSMQRSQYRNRVSALAELREQLNKRATAAAAITFDYYEVEVQGPRGCWFRVGDPMPEQEARDTFNEYSTDWDCPVRLVGLTRSVVQESARASEKEPSVVQEGLPSSEESVTLRPQPAENPQEARLWEIWSEGFSVTGQSAPAQHLGTYMGTSFREACMNWAADNDCASLLNEDALTYWGCKLCPSEAEARVAFG